MRVWGRRGWMGWRVSNNSLVNVLWMERGMVGVYATYHVCLDKSNRFALEWMYIHICRQCTHENDRMYICHSEIDVGCCLHDAF